VREQWPDHFAQRVFDLERKALADGGSEARGHDRRGGEARQLTKLPIDVAGPIWSRQGDRIACAAEVYPGKTPEETAARLMQEMAGNPPPEAVVWFAGANDYVDMRTDSGSLTRGTPEWLAEYRKRAGEVMDIVGRGGGQMYWVGQPIMRDKARSKVAADINIIVQAEAESRPWVHYLDTWAMFTDTSGNYTAFLPDSSGELVRVRQEEGIHLTRTATTWVSDRVYDAMRRDYKFPSP